MAEFLLMPDISLLAICISNKLKKVFEAQYPNPVALVFLLGSVFAREKELDRLGGKVINI